MAYLAHSARPDRGIPEQDYRDHIENVVASAIGNAELAARYSAKYGDLLRGAVRQAAEFHDLGKLDEINQEVLRANRGKMIHHVDAGVAHLLDGLPDSVRTVAALAAFAHHNPGLPAIMAENEKGPGKVFRDATPAPNGTPLWDYTNHRLNEYLRRHQSCLSNLPVARQLEARIAAPQLLLRLALSCLVDADHTDTARNYRDPVANQSPPLLVPELRLKLLDEHVAELSRGQQDERTRLRTNVYSQCREADSMAGFLACDSPVGSGKTTAIMAHLLRAAADKKLRRVFVVLPFTNIIDQSVGVYRKALVHGDEAADDIHPSQS